MLDISDHGGNFGGELAKGKLISPYSLSPKSMPFIKGNNAVNTYSSSGLSFSIDESSNIVIVTGTNGGEPRYVRSYDLNNMVLLKDFFPSEYGTGTNPKLFNAFAYDKQADAFYTSWGGSSYAVIKKISAKSPHNTLSTISTIAHVTTVLKQDTNEIIFLSNSQGSPGIYSLNRLNDSVSLLLATPGEVVYVVSGFKKIVVANTSTRRHRIFDLKMTLLSDFVAPSMLPSGPKMYHSITNTIKVLTHESGTSGGQFFYNYNANTFQYLSKERLSTTGNTSVSLPSNSYYNENFKEWLCEVGDPNSNNCIAIFRINNDGTVKDLDKAKTNSWFDTSYFPTFLSSSYGTVFSENKACVLSQTTYSGNNYRDIFLIKSVLTWEG